MYRFKKDVSGMTGKNYRAGSIVPDGVFHALDEMVKAGDIEEMFEDKSGPVIEYDEMPETENGPEPEVVHRTRKSRK
jgi:hypothetical protein